MVPLLLLAAVLAGAAPALAVTVSGITSANQLITFDAAAPATILTTTPITGLQSGETILAIDFRPLTGQLYGLGSTSRLYVVEVPTGAASEVGSTSFVVPLDGMYFGFDFDPVADRIRVVSDTGQNFRVDPDTGMVVDGDPGTPGIQPDTRLSAGSSVVACAYTNDFTGAATTTLYGIDSTSNTLVRVGGPDGTPSPQLGDVVDIGALTFDVSPLAGLDITANGNQAYAVLRIGLGASGLYTVDLVTGAAALVGTIGDGFLNVRDIALLPGAVTIFGITGANELVRFRSVQPDVITSTLPITGLQPNEDVLGIDARPLNGKLYGLGSMSSMSGAQVGRLYTIDTTTGVATQVGSAPFAVPLDGAAFGFDFNPVTDRLRVVSDRTQNFHLDPDTGEVVDFDPITVGVQPDMSLHFANMNPATFVVGAAYTNDLPGAQSTTLYGIDSLTDQLVRQGGPDGVPPPNLGLITPIGKGLGPNTLSLVGFDIAPLDGTAFASLTVVLTSGLYTVDLVTGAARSIGDIGAQPIRSIAVAPPGRFQFAAPSFVAAEHAGAATITILRTGGSDGPASVRFTASSGSATAGVDFTGVSRTVVFLDGETSKTVDVPLIDDKLVEGSESVNLTLGTPTTSVGSASTAVLIITDDDDGGPPPPVCSTDRECADGDRCTTDTCSSGACTHVLTPRLETVLCTLDAARRAPLCGDYPVKRKILRVIRGMITRTGHLVERAAGGNKRGAAQADKVLAVIQAKAGKAADDTKISRSCGKIVQQHMQGIRDLLSAATPPRHAGP
jgi:hypothetical protein